MDSHGHRASLSVTDTQRSQRATPELEPGGWRTPSVRRGSPGDPLWGRIRKEIMGRPPPPTPARCPQGLRKVALLLCNRDRV